VSISIFLIFAEMNFDIYKINFYGRQKTTFLFFSKYVF
jgi:hypothetical protein